MEVNVGQRRKGTQATRATLTQQAAKLSGRPQHECEMVANAFFEVVMDAVALGASVELRKHFTFVPRTRKARPARNPRTGDVVPLLERKTMWCRFVRGYL